MPLESKPHSLIAFPTDQPLTPAGEALAARPADTQIPFLGQVTPLSSESVFRVYGVESKEAYELLCDVEDGRLLEQGFSLWWDDESAWFKVAAQPKLWTADPATSCAQVLLTRNRLKSEAPTL